jgi:hypothetical protein
LLSDSKMVTMKMLLAVAMTVVSSGCAERHLNNNEQMCIWDAAYGQSQESHGSAMARAAVPSASNGDLAAGCYSWIFDDGVLWVDIRNADGFRFSFSSHPGTEGMDYTDIGYDRKPYATPAVVSWHEEDGRWNALIQAPSVYGTASGPMFPGIN